MDAEDRDRLLREAWSHLGADAPVDDLAEIARRIGPAVGEAASGATVPYTLRNLAAAGRRMSRARGGGATALPGALVLHRAPGALRALAGRLPGRCVLVSGTNGKTTTASMIAAVLREARRAVAHNQAGANEPSGVATALLERRAEVGVFEVDEAWLPLVAAELRPFAIVLVNLFRDRLDSYGELEALASAWQSMQESQPRARLVLNADDPLLAALGSAAGEDGGTEVRFFGIDDVSLALAEAEAAADSIHCRSCGARLRFEARMLSHLGHHRCVRCGAARPRPAVAAQSVRAERAGGSAIVLDLAGERLELSLPLLGIHNVYNALAAVGAALAMGVDGRVAVAGLSRFAPPFGRGERMAAGGRELIVMLMKNPAGANELLRILLRDPAPRLDLLVVLNDGFADGRDVSWIWDADFEVLRARVARVVCSGSRAPELALRLKYAGWPGSGLIVEADVAAALDLALAGDAERLVALPTYSALLQLHAELAGRGFTAPFWAARPALREPP
jgi:UDP-N-acetylmuramyl tripeptide synthase